MTEEIPLINLNKDKQGIYGLLRLADFKKLGWQKIMLKVGNKKIPAEVYVTTSESQMMAVEIDEMTLHFRKSALIDRRLIEKWKEIYDAVTIASQYTAEMIILG